MAKKRKSRPGPYLEYLELCRDRVEDFGRFPFNLPAIQSLDTLSFHPQVTFLVGENGSGKSTLLEGLAVCCGLNPEGGSRHFNFATRESHSDLDQHLRLAMAPALPGDCYFLRAESFYNVASEIEYIDEDPDNQSNKYPIWKAYGARALHDQSHGESFFALFENRFRDNGLYLIDEPEAALSPRRQLRFLQLMHGYLQRGAQFVIATHSPIILSYPASRIYLLGNHGIREIQYTETEHFQITRQFLNDPQQALQKLLDDEAKPAESALRFGSQDFRSSGR